MEIVGETMEETERKTLEPFTEFETKYRVDGETIHAFKALVENLGWKFDFIYVQGDDIYYTKPDGWFARYRRADGEKRAEVTWKRKPEGAKYNIKRKEWNWRVDGTSFEEIEDALLSQGHDRNFEIWKMCHIYKFKEQEVTFVFYTVRDGKKLDHFIEIELDEKGIHNYTEEEAFERIRGFETTLESIGISHRHRLTKSLYEMYVRNIYEDKNL